jgi:hypothetical protein
MLQKQLRKIVVGQMPAVRNKTDVQSVTRHSQRLVTEMGRLACHGGEDIISPPENSVLMYLALK